MKSGRPRKSKRTEGPALGEDGWPADPEHPFNKSPCLAETERAKGPLSARYLHVLGKQWRAGNVGAVALAVELCHEH